ncbi:MAG TPA: PEP-CTERM sorting domain-containing protein [Opitutaceae bacterium]
MKSPLLSLLLVPIAAGTAFADTSFQFSSFGSSSLIFQGTGNELYFAPDVSGYDFQISNASIAGLNGLFGTISGTFTIENPVASGSLQQATVSGIGTLTIYDGQSSYLTANIWWGDALTVGAVGALNSNDNTNVNHISYSGANVALQQLAANTSGSDVVSFQFTPPESLMQLTQDGSLNTTTYSGSLTAVPEPGTYALLIGGCTLVGTIALRRRSKTAPAV